MHENVASRTALMVAAYRARASAAADKLCDDPWAATLAGDLGAELAHKFDARFPHMELWMALRTLEERASLSAQLADRARKRGREILVERYERDMTEARERAQTIRKVLLRPAVEGGATDEEATETARTG
ncbi:Leucine carboxyl methyltransferase [compost metagenome]